VNLRIIIVAAQGCVHARAVVESISEHLVAGEELFIMEELLCSQASSVELESGAKVIHMSTGLVHDFDLAARGITAPSYGDCPPELFLVLEDHAVPDSGFMENLRAFFADGRPQATTFYIRNGTPVDAPSRALYTYVCGLADVDSKRAKIEPVTSSFAITAKAIGADFLTEPMSAARFGWLQYSRVPELMRMSMNQPPRSLYVFHHQVNSLRQAASAVYWNARSNAVIDRGSASPLRLVLRAPIKYLARSLFVLRSCPQDVSTSAMVFMLGSCGFVGWWVGRIAGDFGAGEKIVLAHPVPATAQG